MHPDDATMTRLAPAARVRWRVARVAGGLVPAVLASAPLVPLVLVGDGPTWLFAVPGVLALVGAAVGWWSADVRYRRFGYRLDDDVLRVRDGVVLHTDAAVPLYRVQHVDITRGPLQLAFGLSSLTVHTAAPAADVELPDVLVDDAESLRDQILAAARAAAEELGTVDVDAV